MKINPQVQIEEFERDEDYIFLDFADGTSDTIEKIKFESWLVENHSDLLELSHSRNTSNYREIGLDVESIYQSERIIELLTEYYDQPTVIKVNNFRSFQNFAI